MPIVLKSGNLNLLEPSGAVQACNGIALPFFSLTRIILNNYHICEHGSMSLEKAGMYSTVNWKPVPENKTRKIVRF